MSLLPYVELQLVCGGAAAENQNKECMCVCERERGTEIFLTVYSRTGDSTETWKYTLG